MRDLGSRERGNWRKWRIYASKNTPNVIRFIIWNFILSDIRVCSRDRRALLSKKKMKKNLTAFNLCYKILWTIQNRICNGNGFSRCTKRPTTTFYFSFLLLYIFTIISFSIFYTIEILFILISTTPLSSYTYSNRIIFIGKSWRAG